jgi:hypothetical protein
MKLNRQIALILVAVVAAGGASALVASRTQDQPKGTEAVNKVLNGRAAKQLDDEMTPTVEYEAGSKATANRQLRNGKHDNARWVRNDLDARVSEVVDESEWAIGLTDLPIDKSDLVVEGQVISAEGFLSNDRTGVYSEFCMQVARVLKNATGEVISPSDTVVMERVGGKVKYKSGKIIRYRIEGQGSPIRGQTYLFFLSRSEQGTYRLLTAYQIQGEKVFALDGSRINVRGQGDWVFDKHNGEDLEGFMLKVQEAIKKSQ